MAISRRSLLTWLGSAASASLLGSAAPRAKHAAHEGMGEVCFQAPPTPYDPASGLGPAAARPLPERARCPVCGMFPARAPAWAAQLIFADGDAYFFDSPDSLLRYLQAPARYTPGRQAGEVLAAYVRDMASGAWLAAQAAIYVQGSALLGPMRTPNLPAFADAAAARRFIAERRGEMQTWARLCPQQSGIWRPQART